MAVETAEHIQSIYWEGASRTQIANSSMTFLEDDKITKNSRSEAWLSLRPHACEWQARSKDRGAVSQQGRHGRCSSKDFHPMAAMCTHYAPYMHILTNANTHTNIHGRTHTHMPHRHKCIHTYIGTHTRLSALAYTVCTQAHPWRHTHTDDM